jgi:hypothetical protein
MSLPRIVRIDNLEMIHVDELVVRNPPVIGKHEGYYVYPPTFRSLATSRAASPKDSSEGVIRWMGLGMTEYIVHSESVR